MGTSKLVYGQTYRLHNGYNQFTGGYLDVRGTGCDGGAYCVSTSESFDRDHGSGTWKIASPLPEERPDGTPVYPADDVQLISMYQGGKGGYLAVLGKGCEQNLYCVSTQMSITDAGAALWKVLPDPSSQLGARDGIKEGDAIHLLNGYGGFAGGYLEIRGNGCEGNLFCVSTASDWNRAKGSGMWRLTHQ